MTLLWSESLSGMCAKLRTVMASNNRVHMPWSLYYCLFAPRIHIAVLRPHVIRGESHIQCNATGEVVTTQNDCTQFSLTLSVPRFTELCNPITHQAIELESHPNHPRIQQVFYLKSKKKSFSFSVRGFLEVTSQWEHVLEILANPEPQPINPFCWLKVLLKTRSKSASIEPLIDLLAYM